MTVVKDRYDIADIEHELSELNNESQEAFLSRYV